MEQEGKPSRILTWNAVNSSQSGRSLSWQPGSNDQNLELSEAGSWVFLSWLPPWTWPKECLLKNQAEKASGPNFLTSPERRGAGRDCDQTLLHKSSSSRWNRLFSLWNVSGIHSWSEHTFQNKAGNGSVRKRKMDPELNANRLGYTWAFLLCVFYPRALLDRVDARQIQAKRVEAQTQANIHRRFSSFQNMSRAATHSWPFTSGRHHFWMWIQFPTRSKPAARNRTISCLVKQKCLILCVDRRRWKRWWWTSKHKVEVTLRRPRWPCCCTSGFTGAPELVDQNRLIRTDLRTGAILTEN